VVKVDTVDQLERGILGSTSGGLAVLHPNVICDNDHNNFVSLSFPTLAHK